MARQPMSNEGSYLTPALENARVADAMRAGVIGCPPDTPLEGLARIMATNHVHCVVVSGDAIRQTGAAERPWGIVSDIDLLRATSDGGDLSAADICATEVVTVRADETLVRAAQLMIEHETSHLLVVSTDSEAPMGIISTLDVAGIIAWGRA